MKQLLEIRWQLVNNFTSHGTFFLIVGESVSHKDYSMLDIFGDKKSLECQSEPELML